MTPTIVNIFTSHERRIPGVTIKSLSIATGRRQPGFKLLPLSSKTRTHTHQPYLLPDQVRIYCWVCFPARTRDDCTRYSARAHNCTVMLPEAPPETLSGPTSVSHVITATTARPLTQAKLSPIEGGGRYMGCHLSTAGRLHGHRFHGILVTCSTIYLAFKHRSRLVYFSMQCLVDGPVMYRCNVDKVDRNRAVLIRGTEEGMRLSCRKLKSATYEN